MDWPGIRDRIFGRIDPISAGGEAYRLGQEHTTLYRAHATFTGERRLALSTGEEVTADRVVVAAGSHPVGLDVDGLRVARPRARHPHLRHGHAPGRPAAPDGDHRRRVRRVRDGPRLRRARRRRDPGAARPRPPAAPRGRGVPALHRGGPAPLRRAPVDHPDRGRPGRRRLADRPRRPRRAQPRRGRGRAPGGRARSQHRPARPGRRRARGARRRPPRRRRAAAHDRVEGLGAR